MEAKSEPVGRYCSGAGVADVITLYFKVNTTDDLSEGIVWEGHKAVVRGELISLGSKLKKACHANFQRVLDAIQRQNSNINIADTLRHLRN